MHVTNLRRSTLSKKNVSASKQPMLGSRVACRADAALANSPVAATPTVKIDNVSDAFATVVSVEFEQEQTELLDTVSGLPPAPDLSPQQADQRSVMRPIMFLSKPTPIHDQLSQSTGHHSPHTSHFALSPEHASVFLIITNTNLLRMDLPAMHVSCRSHPCCLSQVTALKNLGLNIRRAKLVKKAGAEAIVNVNVFYITDALTSEKIVKSARLEEIRLTVLSSLASSVSCLDVSFFCKTNFDGLVVCDLGQGCSVCSSDCESSLSAPNNKIFSSSPPPTTHTLYGRFAIRWCCADQHYYNKTHACRATIHT